MIKNTIIFLQFCLFAISMQAQTPQRYRDSVFAEVITGQNLNYNTAAGEKEKRSYLFDIYQPKGDDNKNRPLIIWMHGGGFKFGSKADKNIQLWCKTFAQRGYVCVAINYRRGSGNTLFNFDKFLKASYFAVQDLKTAVAYFRHNAERFGINPDKIVLAGNSAGGIMALQAAFSNNKELAKLAKFQPGEDPDENSTQVLKVAGVINFWGAIYNPDWLKNARTPVVCVLGDRDKIVPPTHKSAPLFGGIDIHQKADAIGLPNGLKVFEGYSHELQKHFNPLFSGGRRTQQRWLQAGQFAADFLYQNIIK